MSCLAVTFTTQQINSQCLSLLFFNPFWELIWREPVFLLFILFRFLLLSVFFARARKRLEKRKVDRVFANHSLSSTASQGTSNIPGFYSHLETARHQRKRKKKEKCLAVWLGESRWWFLRRVAPQTRKGRRKTTGARLLSLEPSTGKFGR